MSYTQFTQEQRYQISALLKTEHSQTEIAIVVGVHKSTISREIDRNRGQRGYRPKQAQRFTDERCKQAVQKRISDETWVKVDEKVREDWSPEQIAGWLKKDTTVRVSPEWIYQHIYLDKRAGGDLHKHLRCQKKRRKRAGDYDRRGKIPNQVSIDDRPDIVEQRDPRFRGDDNGFMVRMDRCIRSPSYSERC